MPVRTFHTATDTYTATGVLGEGGSGVVYKVADNDGAIFAIKLLRSTDSQKSKRFANELNFCQRQNHENIIQVLGSGAFLENGKRQPFFVMPLYEKTLRQVMKEGLEAPRILPLFNQILNGVEAAHLRKIFHRDLKPENILWDSQKHRPVVADFGIAHFCEEEISTAVNTQADDRLANFVYAAPEQRTRGAVDHRADIFSLGLVLNEMFTKTVPAGISHPLIGTAAPEFAFLDEVVNRMIRYAPSERFSSIDEIKKDLLGRGHAFVARQRLDSLSRRVLPLSSPSDALGGQDVRVVDVIYEAGDGLFFTLEPAPPSKWFLVLSNLTGYRSIEDAEPSRVQHFSQGRVRVQASERAVEHVVPLFQDWVSATNAEYRRQLQRESQENYANEVKGLQRERARMEENARVTERLAGLLKN